METDWTSYINELKTLFQGSGGWIVQVFVVVVAALFLDFLQKRLLRRILKRLEHTRNLWDDALVDALRRPLTALIWVVGITFAADIVRQETEAAIFAAVGPLRDVGVIVIIAWFLIRLVRRAEENIVSGQTARGAPVDRATADAIGKLLRISIVITAALVVLQTLGFSISGVLAFGGIGGIAVGFAAKDLLSNFFGGLMLYLDRPFVVGEWIRSPDREIEGTVEEIGWRLTRIRTFDKRLLYVPNAVFAAITVENPSRMSHRRIYETIGLRYDDAERVSTVLEAIRDMLRAHPDIDQGQTLMVNLNSFGPSSLDFFVYAFTRTTVWTEYHEVKERILLQIHDIIAAHGAEVAFPTRTLHVPDALRVAMEGVGPGAASE